jgi:hypothetical protein
MGARGSRTSDTKIEGRREDVWRQEKKSLIFIKRVHVNVNGPRSGTQTNPSHPARDPCSPEPDLPIHGVGENVPVRPGESAASKCASPSSPST